MINEGCVETVCFIRTDLYEVLQLVSNIVAEESKRVKLMQNTERMSGLNEFNKHTDTHGNNPHD